MHMTRLSYLTRLSAVMLLVSLLCVSSFAQEAALGRNCNGETHRVSLYPVPPSCKEWVIEWRKGDGSKYGEETGKTREEVIRKRDKMLAFQKRYARFCECDTFLKDYLNPSEPICNMCMGKSTTNRLFSWENVCNSSTNALCTYRGALVENYITRIIDGMGQFIIAGDRNGDPPPNFGSVLWDYATAMREAQERINGFKSWLDGVTDTTTIDKLMDEALNAGRDFESKYNALPPAARDWLDGRPPTRIQGYWDLNGMTAYIKQQGNTFQVGALEGSTFHATSIRGTIIGSTIIFPDMPYSQPINNPAQCGVPPDFRMSGTVTTQGKISIGGDTITLEYYFPETTVGRCTIKALTERKVWRRVR